MLSQRRLATVGSIGFSFLWSSNEFQLKALSSNLEAHKLCAHKNMASPVPSVVATTNRRSTSREVVVDLGNLHAKKALEGLLTMEVSELSGKAMEEIYNTKSNKKG